MRIFKLLCVVLLAALIAGCATPMKMGLTKDNEKIELGSESLLLLTAELSNEYKPSYQPEALVLHVETPDAARSEDRLNFQIDSEGTFKFEKNNKYIFRARIKPGKYVVRGITGTSGTLVRGFFFVPLHSEIEIKGGSVIDLGKIVATVRERKGDEFRAGPVAPLLDQALTGFSGGTFDVQIANSREEDTKLLKTLFPALRDSIILAQTLPPFDRTKAQKWWEEH